MRRMSTTRPSTCRQRRWPALKDLKHDVGSALNTATEAIEEHNRVLEGVLVTIDFNVKNKLSDSKLRDLITHFSKVPPAQQ